MPEKRPLGTFEKYLSFWVILCIILGILLGRLFPSAAKTLSAFEYAHVSIPIATCLFFMMYPIMVKIDFKEVVKAGKTPKPVALTLIVNWCVKPFTMAFFAWLFMKVVFARFISSQLASQYTAGMILLGVAPCTAMVLVWSYLSKGNMGHTLVMVAINSLSMLILYAPLAGFLLGISNIPIPWETLGLSIGMYVGLPLLAGYYSRKKIISRKGVWWFETRFAPGLHYVSISALLITLIVLFTLQGNVIIDQPLNIGMIALPLYIQTMTIFFITYGIAKIIKLSYEDAAPSAQIGASNHFEVAIAVAVMLFGLQSGASLATVVGVLEEVPVMLSLVWVCLKTQHLFQAKEMKYGVGEKMFKRILVPIDFSEYSEKTIGCMDIFKGIADEALLLHVVDLATTGGAEDIVEFDKKRLEEYANKIVKKGMAAKTLVKLSTNIPAEIIETAEGEDCSLIVIGARGRSLAREMMLGSTSAYVLRKSRKNILVMRHKVIEKCKLIPCEKIFEKVLHPTDFSENAEVTFSFVKKLGMAGTKEIVLLHVVDYGETEEEIKKFIKESEKRLSVVKNGLEQRGLKTKFYTSVGIASNKILEFAEKEKCSLIAMGARGKSILKELLLGSTTEAVVRRGSKPVLVIRK